MRILVIDDEVSIVSFIKRGLKEAGYAVDTACDGEEGYIRAASNDYDLIIMDSVMPKINGMSLCKKLRDEKFVMPIIITSGNKILTDDKIKGLDAGADDYLTKPFDFQELLARIRANLRKKYPQANSKLKAGDLTLDLVSHKVIRRDKEIFLTNKEFTLLEYLMRNADCTVTRTMIAEHVWDHDFDSFSNVIDVYINYLRNKINTSFNRKLIETVKGQGYILRTKE
ncbi:MAG: response regulator transcription factor [Elusimicrobiota bacterium]